MTVLVITLIVLQLSLLTTAVIDLSKGKETTGPKWLWAVIVVIFNTIGPIIYFAFGRKRHMKGMI